MRFCLPPPGRTQDQWHEKLYLEDEGNQYWIKVHHSLRTKKFHPVHRGQPMDVDLLGAKRIKLNHSEITKVVNPSPMRMTVMFHWQVVVGHLNDAWTSGPLLMKESLIDGLVLPFFGNKMKAKYQPGEDAGTSPWIGETVQGEPAMTGGDFPTRKSTGKEGSVTRGTETPSVVVYVNNYTGSSGSMTVEGKGGYQEVHEEGALGKAHGKAQRRGRAAVGQTTAEGSMPAAGSSLRQSSNDGWSIISDAERN